MLPAHYVAQDTNKLLDDEFNNDSPDDMGRAYHSGAGWTYCDTSTFGRGNLRGKENNDDCKQHLHLYSGPWSSLTKRLGNATKSIRQRRIGHAGSRASIKEEKIPNDRENLRKPKTKILHRK